MASEERARVAPATADTGAIPARGNRRRDRHGRGPRGAIVPGHLPVSRTRAQQFDDRVLDAVEHLERRWAQQLAGVEFAVEDVPEVDSTDPDEVITYDSDVVEDGAVPLARLIPGRRSGGHDRPPRIVLYRRPIEARAADAVDLDDLVHDVVVEQVAHLLDMHPDELDPPAE